MLSALMAEPGLPLRRSIAEVLGPVDPDVLRPALDGLVEPVARTDDEESIRRFAELLGTLRHEDLLARLVGAIAGSPHAEIREIAEDFGQR